MNERRIVEQALLVSLLIQVVETGSCGSADPTLVEAARELHLALRDVVSPALPSAQGKLIRRVKKHGQNCVTPNVPLGSQIGVFGLAVYAILEHLIEEEYLVIGEESSLSKALDIILSVLEPSAAIDGNLERGRRMAALILCDFQRDGLFGGVTPIVQFARSKID